MAAKLLLDEEPLVISPSLATIVGLNESIVLQQLHYWLERSTHIYEGYKWVYNTYEEWQKQFPFWSESTIRRIITKMEKQELIISGNFNRSKIDKTKWYRINYEKLAQLEQLVDEANSSGQDEQTTVQSDASTVQIEQSTDEIDSPSVQNEQSICSNLTDDLLNLTRPIPENTTKITAEIKKEEVEEDACVRNFKEIVYFYEQNGFGVISDYLREKISAWVDDTSEDLVLEALKIAVENGAKRWVYVETILRDWAEKGYRTVDQVRAAQLAFREQQSRKRNGSNGSNHRKPTRKEMIPDWLNIDYSQYENKVADDPEELEQKRRELEERLKKYRD
jgi:DnaD/phage-associated family protein